MAVSLDDDLPDANNPNLVLRHPTADECVTIWTSTSAAWVDSLTLPLYLKESLFLTTVPLAHTGGMTIWVLVDKNQPPDQRQILCSCESFLKHSLTSDAHGTVSDNIVHGIASVFCPIPYRRRGYAARMMRELIKELYTWRIDRGPCVGTTLYSDIGPEYYTKLGWPANITNGHIEMPPVAGPWPTGSLPVLEGDIAELCKRDEALIRSQMARPTDEVKTRFTIIPDWDHVGWHLGKEDFATDYLFGKNPTAKGVIVGKPGSQAWATWVHRYYGRHDVEDPSNVLYILRLTMELDETATRLPADAAKRPSPEVLKEQTQHLKAILQAAQAEAAEWKLDVVKLWDPSPLVVEMLKHIGLEYTVVEREEDSLASLQWYGPEGGVGSETPFWVNNEHYAWQ